MTKIVSEVRESVTSISALVERRRQLVSGTVLYVEVSSSDQDAVFTARLTDGSGTMDCVFLGRRLVPGIEPGTQLDAEGMVSRLHGALSMYNPRYVLRQR